MLHSKWHSERPSKQEPELCLGMLVISWEAGMLLLGQPGTTGTAPAQSQHKWRHGVGKISEIITIFQKGFFFLKAVEVSHQLCFQVWAAEQGMSSLPTRNGAEGFTAGVVLGTPLPELLTVLQMCRGSRSEALCPGRAKTRIGNVLILSGIILLWQEYRLDYLISHLKKKKVQSLSQCYSTRNPTKKKKSQQ